MNALEGWKKAQVETFAPGELVENLEGMAAQSLQRDYELYKKHPPVEFDIRKYFAGINQAVKEIQKKK